LLKVDGSSGAAQLHVLAGLHRRAPVPAAAAHLSTVPQVASASSSAASFDRSTAFHVYKLMAEQAAEGAPAQPRESMLAAYHAPLARRIRYFGPLTPVDRRV
jgi:hypothetical protein